VKTEDVVDGIINSVEGVFADYVIIGIDITGKACVQYRIGTTGESMSNEERVNRVVGEMESAKLRILFGGYEFVSDDVEATEDGDV